MLRSLLVVTLGLAAITAQENASTIGAGAYQELRYRLIGPFRASRTVAGVGIPDAAQRVLRGRPHRRRVEDRRLRTHVASDLRQRADRIDRRHRRFVVEPRHHLRRNRRRAASAGSRASATASSSRSTAANRGSTSASATCSRSGASSSIRPTRTSCSSPASAIRTEPNAERGIFRTTNGGATWEKVLFVNENTGGIQVEFDPKNPNVVYGSMWEHREGPWENASFFGPNSGLYKSTDGGTTWRQLKGGLPSGAEGAGRICLGIGVSDPNRLYAAVMGQGRGAEGFYRSNDGGESWTLVSKDSRLGLDVRVHPANPTSSSSATSPRIDRMTAARRGRRSRVRRAATTTSASGSIRSSPTSCSSPRTRVPSSR